MAYTTRSKAISSGGFGALSLRIRLFFAPKDWEPIHVPTDVVATDGTLIKGVVMRKRAGDKIIYRQATRKEADDFLWMRDIK